MNICYRNFTGGEVSPTLAARYDLQKAGTFLLCCQNMLPNPHGDAERRGGTHFLAELDGEAVLVPFRFNTDKENNFAIAFGASIQIFNTDGVAQNCSLPNPYGMEDAYGLSFAQVADVLYLAHKKHPLRKLTRSGIAPDYVWDLQEVRLNQSLAAPQGGQAAFVRGNPEDVAPLSYTLAYKITAVDGHGMESLPSAVINCQGKYPTDWVTGNHVDISWQAVDGAEEYNIYRESAGYFGFIGIAKGTSFQDQNFEADSSMTPKADWQPFSGGNNPSTVAFHQQRLFIGGTALHPSTLYAGRTGDFEDFRKSSPMRDDDPLEYTLAGGSVDEIRWIAGFGDLLVGTAGAEYKASSSGAALTPSDIAITPESYWGSGALRPIIIGNSVMHCQRSGSRVRDLYYTWENDGYGGNDLSLLAPHLVEGMRIRQWAFCQAPGPNLWCVRDDGVLLCLTYIQEQRVYAWSRHVTDGAFLGVCVLSAEDGDKVFFVVRRNIGGREKYFLESLEPPFGSGKGIEDAYFVDCGKSFSFAEAAEEVGLAHLEGKSVDALADGSPQTGLAVADGVVRLGVPAKKIHIGLPYAGVLCPLPPEADLAQGSTLGGKRGVKKCTVRLFRSLGGSYAPTKEGDLYKPDAWKERAFFDLPFLPALFGSPCELFSGDLPIRPCGGLDVDSSLWLKQDRPLPFRITAICMETDFFN